MSFEKFFAWLNSPKSNQMIKHHIYFVDGGEGNNFLGQKLLGIFLVSWKTVVTAQHKYYSTLNDANLCLSKHYFTSFFNTTSFPLQPRPNLLQAQSWITSISSAFLWYERYSTLKVSSQEQLFLEIDDYIDASHNTTILNFSSLGSVVIYSPYLHNLNFLFLCSYYTLHSVTLYIE